VTSSAAASPYADPRAHALRDRYVRTFPREPEIPPTRLAEAVALVRGRAELKASGGITLTLSKRWRRQE
jgi:hypothetical protein